MAQAWHRRPAEESRTPKRFWLRRASAHRFGFLEGWADYPFALEAAPAAKWARADPFETYRPTSKKRELEAGPHLQFAGLGDKARGPTLAFEAGKFADAYGLLGLFHEFCSAPIPPEGKLYVAPNAVIDGSGRLSLVDPATAGKAYLEDLIYKRDGPSSATGDKIHFDTTLVLPEELAFYPTHDLAWLPAAAALGGPLGGETLSWKDVEEEYGTVAVLDRYAERGVSIVPTRERLSLWKMEASTFARIVDGHTDPTSVEGLNNRVADASPYAIVTDGGGLDRGWRCRSLLQAMYVMLYLDRTGGNAIRKCQLCRAYYRPGPQTASMYCSEKHASLASTRRGRSRG